MLLVVGQLGLGGTERQVVLLASALLARGVDVRVCAMYAGGPRERELAEAGVPVWIGSVPSSWQVWRLATSLVRFLRLVREQRPDVVHAFLFHAYVLAGPLSRLAGVPAVVAGRRSLGTFLQGRPVLRLAAGWSNRSYDAFVANAQAVADDSLRRERVRADRMHVIPNALPPEAFTRVRDPERPWDDPVRLVCVANLIHYKGHRHLLDALALLGQPVHLDLIGDGPERVALAAQATGLGLDVALLGARTDVPALLAAADVFVLPSLEEGMSNALMEAMAAGLPCIATDVGGNREVLADAGVLCRPGDAADLAAGLRHVLDDPGAARALGAAARSAAASRFGIDALGDAHLALYSRLLEVRCAASPAS